jgi:1A family penicillin-binding protein
MMSMKAKTKKNKFAFKFLLKKSILISLYLFVTLVLITIGGFAYLMVKTPLGNSLYSRNISQTSFIYDRTGTHILYEMYGEENRIIISHEEIPNTIRIATIATEDGTFYQHHGLDPLALLRALKNDIAAGSASQGGSTITQQLARNVFLTRDKTIQRKIMEAVYAVKIERKYSKEEILDSYLNQVPYGSNTYGIESASETYFGKPAKELTLDEAAMVAVLTKAPTTYSPYGNKKDVLVVRQKEILTRIAKLNLESSQAVADALKADTLKKIVPFTQSIAAPHFVFYVLDQLEKQYGQQKLEEGGLKIYTTLDWDKQQLAEQILKNNSDKILKKYEASNVALVAIDPQNGQILAMVGSKDYFSKSIDGQVNVAISLRQPGSSFKPFVYAKAFEAGFQPETLVLDAQTNFGPDGSGKDYIPQNYDGTFHGVVSMWQALAGSLNIPAIKTLREVGLSAAIEIAHRLGITTLNDPQRYGLSLVIGGGEVTLLDETSGFSVFANDGKRNPVDPILKIVDNKGVIIRQNIAPNTPVLDPQVARKIDSILSDNSARISVFGPNNKLFIPGWTVAAKTGTTQEFRDAWTVGFTPYIAVGVWVGNNNSQPMLPGADGSFVAAPIWNQFMSQVIKEYPNTGFPDYDTSKNQPVPQVAFPPQQTKIIYYKIASGKKISESKAKKLGPDKVRTKIEVVTVDGSTIDVNTSVLDSDLGSNSGIPAF